jgi:hypothetical protein
MSTVHLAPTPASMLASSTYCGTCVDLPQPVSPQMTTTCSLAMAASTAARESKAGSAERIAWRRLCVSEVWRASCSRSRRSLSRCCEAVIFVSPPSASAQRNCERRGAW